MEEIRQRISFSLATSFSSNSQLDYVAENQVSYSKGHLRKFWSRHCEQLCRKDNRDFDGRAAIYDRATSAESMGTSFEGSLEHMHLKSVARLHAIEPARCVVDQCDNWVSRRPSCHRRGHFLIFIPYSFSLHFHGILAAMDSPHKNETHVM